MSQPVGRLPKDRGQKHGHDERQNHHADRGEGAEPEVDDHSDGDEGHAMSPPLDSQAGIGLDSMASPIDVAAKGSETRYESPAAKT